MIEFKENVHSCWCIAYSKLQWVNTFMSMKHIHVKVYIKYNWTLFVKSQWFKALSMTELIHCMKGIKGETNLTGDVHVFSPCGPLLPYLTFVHGDGVTTAGGVSSPPHCVLLLYRFALTPFVEQFCQSGGSWDRRFNRILHKWNSFSTHLPKTLKLTKCNDKQCFWTYKRDLRHVTINRNSKSNIYF